MGLVTGPQTLTFFVKRRISGNPSSNLGGATRFLLHKKRYGHVVHAHSAESATGEDVRVVKESGLRSAGAIRVGSNPTPRNFYDSYEGS